MIRWADPDEHATVLAHLMFDAVREGDSPYSTAERQAWMPQVPDPIAFADRLRSQDVAVAERHNRPAGFASLTRSGYVDLFFILPAFRGQGVFRALYRMLEDRAVDRGMARMATHASLTAQPAFQSVGFLIIQHEIVDRAGQKLKRAEMEKYLK